MPETINIRIFDDESIVGSVEAELPIILGRQAQGEPDVGRIVDSAVGKKLIIARFTETTIGRTHLHIEPIAASKVSVRNINEYRAVLLTGMPSLGPREKFVCDLPTIINFEKEGGKRIILNEVGRELKSSSSIIEPPLSSKSHRVVQTSLMKLSVANIGRAELISWLDNALEVLQSAVDSDDFFHRAVKSAIEMVELDQAHLILFSGDDWNIEASHSENPKLPNREPSRKILQIVQREKRSFWQSLELIGKQTVSLEGVEAVVVSPILDQAGTVRGALYGLRLFSSTAANREPIGEIESRLVELLAKVVATGIARLEQQKVALAAKVQFEQFFTPQLAQQLSRLPDWDKGREAHVTALFSDIRGFSRISEKLDPAVTVHWIQDVLGMLSDCVLRNGGVLVDYIGDALMAIWGAPEEQPDHAARACTAALEMLACLPILNKRWEQRVGEKTELSIGMNSGMAQVGNTGSKRKFKYGALGSNVNLASRIQGATKYLKTYVLMTEATQKLLPPDFCTRRIAEIRPNNFEASVRIHELIAPDHPAWPRIKTDYERALYLFEAGQFKLAARMMGNWQVEFPDDGAALVLLYRSVNGMVEGKNPDHPTWVFKEK